MNSPQPTLTLLEWSLPALFGAGIGIMVAQSLGARGMGALWLGALGGTAAGLALGTSIWPPPLQSGINNIASTNAALNTPSATTPTTTTT